MIEVRIGVADVSKELSLEIDDKPEGVVERVTQAITEGSGILWLTDQKGNRVGVPVPRIAYVEVESETGPRSVGFGTR